MNRHLVFLCPYIDAHTPRSIRVINIVKCLPRTLKITIISFEIPNEKNRNRWC